MKTRLRLWAAVALVAGVALITPRASGQVRKIANAVLGPTGALVVSSTAVTSGVPILHANGTVAAPSITFTSDPDGGLYSIAGNRWGMSAAGSGIAAISAGTGLTVMNGFGLSFSASGDNAADLFLRYDAANTLAQRNGTNAQRFNLGQGNTALAAGRLAMGRDAAAAFAPGAGYGLLRWETGTNAGTLKLVAYAGTSTTGVTVVDNVGGGN